MATVLAVDDDPVIQRLLEVNLEMEGYDVLLAGDGEQALATAKSARPDLILLDIMMPVKDGWTVCEELKADPELAGIPVIFLSARAQELDVERGNSLGADDYFTKPFDPIELIDRIAELIHRA